MRAAACVLISLLASSTARAQDHEVPIGHRETAWQRAPEHRAPAMKLGAAYRRFLGAHKTVREVAGEAIRLARRAGFRPLFEMKTTASLKPGAKVYADVHGKIAAFAVVGERPPADGVHVIAAHIDSVRIDLKQRPLYADANMALLETHYYGGLKKFHWLSQPLELRGVVVKPGGEVVKVAIGDDPDEPVLVIPDVAVHLNRSVDHVEGESVPGEKLDPIVATTAAAESPGGGDPFAAEAARLLARAHGIDVADLVSAELELVPAAAPRDVGLDAAAIGGYGQDDRACAYAALRAILDARQPARTAIVVLVDKEETGSEGNTGARSAFLRRFVGELLERTGAPTTELAIDRAMSRSMVMSADVTGAINPLYAEVYDARNNLYLGSGVAWDQSGLHAEVLGYVRDLFDRAGVVHQAGSWTRVGASRGGTVLEYFTRHGMTGIDVSIPLLSMHSTYEIISKADLYEAYRAYKAFLED